jgi:O-antigen/teichoic acid export membrane protein
MFPVVVRTFEAFRARLAADFFWSIVCTLALQGSVFLTSVVLARMLGLTAFGVYALATSTVMTVVGIAQGGVGIFGTKFVGEWLHSQPHRIGRMLHMCAVFTSITGLLAVGVLWGLAPLVASTLFSNSGVAPAIRWVSVGALFHVQTVYLLGALQGFGAFRAISRAGSIVGAFHCIVSVVAAYFWSLDGAVIAFTLSSVARWWFFRGALRKTQMEHGIVYSRKVLPEDWALIWQFALPAGLASMVTLPCMWGVTALVAMQPGGVAWVGLFSVAHQLRQLVMQLPALLNTVTSSVLSRLKGQNAGSEFWRVFRANLMVGVGYTSAVAVLLSLASTHVLGLYGAGFIEGRDLLLVLLVAVIPEAIGVTAYQLVLSSGSMWRSLLLIMGPRDLLYLALAAWALPLWGLVGAGGAYLAAYIFYCLATLAVGLGSRVHLPSNR